MAFYSRGTITTISRALFFTSNSNSYASPFIRTCLQCRFPTSLLPLSSAPISTYPSDSLKVSNFNAIQRHFSSTKKSIDTKVNFSLSDSETDDENTPKEIDKNKKLPPPPYDPFSKKPAIEEPNDPKDLQEIFHNMRGGDGLFNHAVKMFDALSKEGLTHEALELFRQIKDKGQMPDVVAHTAILEAYANARQPKEVLKVYMRMLASGVSPNAYTYAVLIKGLATASDAKFLRDANKFVLEMMDKGMRPNAETYTSLFEALVREEKLDEAAQLLEQMKAKGFVPDEQAVREVLKNKRGLLFRTVFNILFGK
ncbi:pentatricopeptide repeat-containing protein At4g38150-like [Gastrolobium bilobum]|uniref:pentatricopeptide repeat-containing protein At4g38150-like n=1 Tax=Gastrolobium bilobum TaxID=150636 RepID=UPI002AAF2C90|nr:pentatricopeptide repeat-containing protein At4g38150-like [Gastrolobium bilobum]